MVFDPSIKYQHASDKSLKYIKYSCSTDWLEVRGFVLVDTDEWSEFYQGVVVHTPSNTHWLITEERGAAGSSHATMRRVTPTVKVITTYEVYKEAKA
jgi:hypothetical protein